MKTPEERRATLLARLAELDTRLHEIEDQLDGPHSKDWDDMAIERESDEVLERLGQSGQGEIVRIRAALKRLREGKYGICARCGDDISEARLDVLPDAPLCKTCAAAS